MDKQTKSRYLKIRNKLRSHRKRARASLVGKHKKASSWLVKKSLALPGAKDSVKLLTSAGLAGSLLLSSPAKAASVFPPKHIEEKIKLGFANLNVKRFATNIFACRLFITSNGIK